MSDSSVDLEIQAPAHPHPAATGSDDEEDQRCWRDVEAETGHSSYKSFLEALPETGPQYERLRQGIDKYGSFGEVHVLEIGKDGAVSISMKLQGLKVVRVTITDDGSSVLETHRKKSTQLLRNLRSPPENTSARIVVCSTGDPYLHSCLVDAIGLGLKIQPVVFASLLSKSQYGFKDSLGRPMGPDYVVIGNGVAAVARNYVNNKTVPPVLFVAIIHQDQGQIRHFDVDCNDVVKEALTSEIRGSMSLCSPASEVRSLQDLAPESSGYLGRLNNHVYLKFLSKYIQKGTGVDAQSEAQVLNAILALLDLEVLALRPRYEFLRTTLVTAYNCSKFPEYVLNQHVDDALDRQRFGLRRKLEDLEESRSRFVKFARLQNAPRWLEGQPWLSQEEEIIEAVSEARAVEAEARDYMQLQIGNLSILESRKSIELSSQQMSEAKRGKSSSLPIHLTPR